jgi:predicted MFS family arabinose efflux permease
LLLVFGYSHLSLLFIFALLAGLAQTVDSSLRQVVIFDLVPRRMTPNAVALVQTGWSLMRSFGPGIGGFLILWIGAGGNFLVQAGASVLIALTIIRIQFPVRTTEACKGSVIENIREGVWYIIREPVTRTYMLIGVILPLFIIPTFVILPAIYAKDVFHGGSDTLGILMSSVGVGGIVGGFATASLGRVERRGLLQIGSLLMVSLALIAFAFCTELWMALPILAVAGFFEMIFLATNQTLLQLSIPDHLRGRVTTIINLNMALGPLGGMVAGVGSDLFGGPKMITIIMSGIAAGIAVIIYFASPSVRNYHLSDAISQKQDSTP